MQWYSWAAIPVAVFGFWMYTVMMAQSFPTLVGKRIVLLIAHPDDEAMFFGPTLLALTRPGLGNHIKILCLSSGDADGLGDIRKKELVKSGLALGLRSEDDVIVIEDSNFPDSMSVNWPPRQISSLLLSTFAPKMAKLSPKSPPEAKIDTVITFDTKGVSDHPNHKSLYFGAHAFLKALMHRHSGWECPIKLYTLTSTNMARKYLSVMDAPFTILNCIMRKKEIGANPTPLLFVSSVGGYRTAQRAMTTAHKSQMRWFRWGWISLSRYMIINDLKKEKLA